MATVAKSGTPSLSSVQPSQNNMIVGLLAGEAIAAGDLCYINSAGAVMLSNGTTAGSAAAKVDGIAMEAAPNGEAVTLYRHVNVRYGAALTPGTRLFAAAATPGALSDVATTGGTAPIGFVVDATRVHIHGSYY